MALTDQQKKEIQDSIAAGEKAAKELQLDINKATAAGLDVSEHRTQLAELQKNLASLKLHYGK